jgi:hypothetical protein
MTSGKRIAVSLQSISCVTAIYLLEIHTSIGKKGRDAILYFYSKLRWREASLVAMLISEDTVKSLQFFASI